MSREDEIMNEVVGDELGKGYLILGFFLIALMGALGILANGLSLSFMWNWFVQGITVARPITPLEGCGLFLTIFLATSSGRRWLGKGADGRTSDENGAEVINLFWEKGVIQPAVLLGLGFIVKTIIGV